MGIGMIVFSVQGGWMERVDPGYPIVPNVLAGRLSLLPATSRGRSKNSHFANAFTHRDPCHLGWRVKEFVALIVNFRSGQASWPGAI